MARRFGHAMLEEWGLDPAVTYLNHGTVGAGLENCMVVRGWRVVSVAEAQGKALASFWCAVWNQR